MWCSSRGVRERWSQQQYSPLAHFVYKVFVWYFRFSSHITVEEFILPPIVVQIKCFKWIVKSLYRFLLSSVTAATIKKALEQKRQCWASLFPHSLKLHNTCCCYAFYFHLYVPLYFFPSHRAQLYNFSLATKSDRDKTGFGFNIHIEEYQQ